MRVDREALSDLLRWGAKSPGSPAARAGGHQRAKKFVGTILLGFPWLEIGLES